MWGGRSIIKDNTAVHTSIEKLLGERRLGVKQLLMVLYLRTLSMQVFISFDVTLAHLL